MKRQYDIDEARALRPLITSIARELEERFVAVSRLEKRLRRIDRRGDDDTRRAMTVAELAEHRRNLRHATDELETLGCEVEQGTPVVIRLPGPDGSFETGYRMGVDGEALPTEQAA